MKRLFEFGTKLDIKGIGHLLGVNLLQGIQFSHLFPKLTEVMYNNAYEQDMDYWDGTSARGLVIPEELRAKTLEETERVFLQIVALYVSEYYPELVDFLGLRVYC